MADNPAIPQPPLKFDATPASLPCSRRRAKTTKQPEVVDKILAKVSPLNATFANSILPLIEAENERFHNDPPIWFYSRASPSEEIRNTSRQAEKLLSDALADFTLPPGII